MRLLGAILFSAFLWGASLVGTPALAANPQTVKLCAPTTGTACPDVSQTNPLWIQGTLTATLGGWQPNGQYGTLTATASTSASTAMPTGTVVAFQNTSSVDLSCVFAAGSATATTNKTIIRAGATVYITVGSNLNAACINQTGSASNVVVMSGGSGLGTNFGGASSGGGGGTVAQGTAAANSGAWPVLLTDGTNNPSFPTAGADAVSNILTGLQVYSRSLVFNGTTFDRLRSGTATGSLLVNNPTAANFNASVVGLGTAGSPSGGVLSIQGVASGTVVPVSVASLPLPSGAATSANQSTEITSLATIATNTGASVPAGTAIIGKVGIDQTTPGTTNAVAPSTPVGAANFTPAQVSVASTATVIAAARTGAPGTGRASVTITNTTTTAIYLGGSGVTTSTGTLLPGIIGASVTINTTAAVYGIVASSTATVTEFETY